MCCAHTQQRYHICIDCGAQLCTHHHASLRGCMLPEGHSERHYNPNSTDGFTWTDEEGTFVNNRTDWVGLVDRLGKGE